MRYYAKIEDSPLSDLFRQDKINTDEQLIVFYDYIWKDCTYTGRSIGSRIVFYQGEKIDHCTHVPGTFDQYSAESDYNASYTAVMDIEKISMINKKFTNKDSYVVL